MSNHPEPVASDEIKAAAAAWVARRAVGLSPVQRQDFQAWMAASPLHRQALAEVDSSADDCDWAWETGVVDTVMAKLDRRRAQRQRRRTAVATLGAVCLVAALWLAVQNRTAPPVAGSPLVVVAPRHQVLPDGSRLDLSDTAAITLQYSAGTRRIVLTAGTAHFIVVSDPNRPFVVSAGGVETRALGTAFSVRFDPRVVEVLCTEGRVSVQGSSPLAVPSLGAGESIKVPLTLPLTGTAAPEIAPATPAVEHVSPEEIAARTAWRLPKLQFEGTTLREIVDQMNRHNQRQLVIADSSLENLRLSGILRADKVEILAELVETDLPVQVERTEKVVTFRRR